MATEHKFEPDKYWDDRLSESFSLKGVGHASYTTGYNGWLYRAQEDALRKIIDKYQVDVSKSSVLDIGSGIGYWLNWYRGLGAEKVTGIEFSPTAAERLLSQFPDLDVYESDISKELPTTAKFDLINVMSVIFHIVDDAAFGRALDNMASALNPEGLLLLSDRIGSEDKHDAEHAKFRSRKTYEEQLGARGLQIVDTVPLFALLNGGLRNMMPGRIPALKRISRTVENRMPGLLYRVDRLIATRITSNLTIMVIRRT